MTTIQFFLIFYCVISYLFMFGVAAGQAEKIDWTGVLVLLLAPISLPFMLGNWLNSLSQKK